MTLQVGDSVKVFLIFVATNFSFSVPPGEVKVSSGLESGNFSLGLPCIYQSLGTT